MPELGGRLLQPDVREETLADIALEVMHDLEGIEQMLAQWHVPFPAEAKTVLPLSTPVLKAEVGTCLYQSRRLVNRIRQYLNAVEEHVGRF